MKAKFIGLVVLVLHVVGLAGFTLMQGCTTGDSPIPWLNWPYSTPREEPMIAPSEDYMAPLPPVTPVESYEQPSISSTPYTAPIEESTTYTVQKGDTLSSIASMYGTSWKRLAEFNNMSNPNRLYVGQEIKIPASLGTVPEPVRRAPSPSKSSSSPKSSISQGTSYVIQKGDTLSGIASRSGITVTELKVANSLTSDRIVAGKSLTIPKKGSVKAPAVAKPAPKKAANPEPAPVAAASTGYTLAPVAEPEPAPEAAPVAEPAAAPVYEHVLYPGETLEDVARQYGSSQSEIMQLNNITDPASVKPGTKLLVPLPE